MRRLSDRLTALLVSADARFAGLYQRKLELDGYRVEVVTPASAPRLTPAKTFDLIFVDIDPDPATAGALIQRLRRRKSLAGVPVLALSATADAVGDAGIRLGVRDRLVKVPSFIR